MSASKPAAVRPSCRYLWSKFSQRGDDFASGRITQARPAVAASPLADSVPPPELEHPASRTTAALASAAVARSDDFFIIRLSSLNSRGAASRAFEPEAILLSAALGVKT